MAKRFSKKLPDDFQPSNLGSCVYTCYILTEYNIKRGFIDFAVVKGKAVFEQINGSHRGFHVFFIINGEIYDPTFEQFFKYPSTEFPISTYIEYEWEDTEIYTPKEFLEGGSEITEEFKKWHYTETKQGEFFKGAMWQSEVIDPERIPPKCRV